MRNSNRGDLGRNSKGYKRPHERSKFRSSCRVSTPIFAYEPVLSLNAAVYPPYSGSSCATQDKARPERAMTIYYAAMQLQYLREFLSAAIRLFATEGEGGCPTAPISRPSPFPPYGVLPRLSSYPWRHAMRSRLRSARDVGLPSSIRRICLAIRGPVGYVFILT